MNTKRTFISIDLPVKLKDYLKSLQKKEIRWVRWSEPQNWHITLNFLGNLEPLQITQVMEILQNTALQQKSFELTLETFKGERDMLWLEPSANQTLTDLQNLLKEQLLEQRLMKKERRAYSPHVLLARGYRNRHMTWSPDNFQPQTFFVDKINLYESRLTPGAATHFRLQSYPLLP